MKRFLVAAFSVAAFASLADATVIFYDGNDPARVDENILFRGGDTGPVIQGVTNQSGELIDFSDAGIDLFASQAEGQAMLLGANDQTFTALTISRDNPDVGFGGLVLDVRLAHGEQSGTITFTTTEMGGGSTTSETFDLGNGQNYFTIYSDDPNSLLSQVSFQTDGDVADVRHVRIGGVAPVPEPASIACLSIGALALLRRRRKS
jgi:hypothetical protein